MMVVLVFIKEKGEKKKMKESIRKRIRRNKMKRIIKMFEYNINWLVYNKNGIVIIRNY